MKLIDLIGERFGRLVVVSQSGRIGRRVTWECKCDCGNMHVTSGENLRNGDTTSCGCLFSEKLSKRNYKHGSANSPLYLVWAGMMDRCRNPNNSHYARYGGRGIKVCDRWKDFANFQADIGKKTDGLTLDRIDNDRGYEPGNCRWASYQQQARNKSTNTEISFRGQTKCLAEWADVLGIPQARLIARIKMGWPVERAFTAPRYDRSHQRKP